MIAIPPVSTLEPRRLTLAGGLPLFLLPSDATELVRIDIIDEAGSAYQPHPLCAGTALKLHTVASGSRSAREVAEWIDYHGVVVEHSPGVLSCSTTFYTLRRYADELLPLVAELRAEPAFPDDEFAVHCRKRRQEILANRQKSREVARTLFYQTLFGSDHPLGRFACPEDADRLSPEAVQAFYRQRYLEGGCPQVVLSGSVDDALVERLASVVLHRKPADCSRLGFSVDEGLKGAVGCVQEPIAGAVQTTLRIGRVLPLRWDSVDYARFMLLTTLLGGYFGSRLMGNLREDKGYTYGVYARTQVYRGCSVFYIVADVAGGTAEAAEQEVRGELRRLREEPVSDDELQLVKTVLAGDFIRSVDGIFERAERLSGMLQTDVDERLTENIRRAIADTTPEHLQRLASQWLKDEDLLFVRAGV